MTAPQHFTAHPFWHALEYDGTCDGADSVEKLGRFVLGQFDGFVPELEYIIYIRINQCFFVVSVVAVLSRLRRSVVGTIQLMGQNILSCFFTMALLFMHIHFQNDNTFFVGNMLHHADISRWTTRSNASSVDMIPQGFLSTYVYNITWLMLSLTLIFKFDPLKLIPKGDSFLTASQIILTANYFKWFLQHRHTAYHELARPEWKDSLPFSFKYKAYTHVFVHHDDGDSFGSSAIFDPIFSWWFDVYAYVHNDLLGLKIETASHYLYAIVADTLFGLFLLGLVYAIDGGAAATYEVDEQGKGALRTTLRRAFATFFTASSICFFMLTLGMLEDDQGDFYPGLRFLDLVLPEEVNTNFVKDRSM